MLMLMLKEILCNNEFMHCFLISFSSFASLPECSLSFQSCLHIFVIGPSEARKDPIYVDFVST